MMAIDISIGCDNCENEIKNVASCYCEECFNALKADTADLYETDLAMARLANKHLKELLLKFMSKEEIMVQMNEKLLNMSGEERIKTTELKDLHKKKR